MTARAQARLDVEPANATMALTLRPESAEAAVDDEILWQLSLRGTGSATLSDVVAEDPDGRRLSNPIEVPRGEERDVFWTSPARATGIERAIVRARDDQGRMLCGSVSASVTIIDHAAEVELRPRPDGARRIAAHQGRARADRGEVPPRAGAPRRWRRPAIGLLTLLACAATAAVILHLHSSPEKRSTSTAGRLVKGHLTSVPWNRVIGSGDAVVRLNGPVAQVSVSASGLFDDKHLMHIHAGGVGRCPPERAARLHAGHRAISTHDALAWYGYPRTSLTTRGDTSPRSIVELDRYKTGTNLHYSRPIRVSPRVADEIRAGNAVLVVHGIDYNHNGKYDVAALNRSGWSSEEYSHLPGETTAPALCGKLVAQQSSGTGGTKTARAPGQGKPQIFTASLNVRPDPLATWLCHVDVPTDGDRTRT